MPKTIGFRPTKEFLDRLKQYMATHHINDRSDAIRAILKECHDQKKELETFRNHLKKKSPQPQETMKPTDCLKGLKFMPKDQHYFCDVICKKKTPDVYRACQKLKHPSKTKKEE